MDLATWNQVLALGGLEVVEAGRTEDGKGWLLAVVSTASVGLCPHCKKPSGSRHTVTSQHIHDLPIAGQPLLLEMQVVQFACKSCDKTFTVHPPCVLEGTHVTVRLAEAITDCVNVSTLTAAAATYHLPESTVKAIFEQVVHRRLDEKARTLKPITKLGIDEIHVEMRDPSEEKPAPGCADKRMTDSGKSTRSGEKIGRG